MVSGTRPFDADSDYGLIRSAVEDETKPLSATRDDVSVGLDRVIEKALANNPGERHQSVEDLLAALRRFNPRLSYRGALDNQTMVSQRLEADSGIAAVLVVMPLADGSAEKLAAAVGFRGGIAGDRAPSVHYFGGPK